MDAAAPDVVCCRPAAALLQAKDGNAVLHLALGNLGVITASFQCTLLVSALSWPYSILVFGQTLEGPVLQCNSNCQF